MIYLFDLDGTICGDTFGKYKEAKPFHPRMDKVNQLYTEGHIIHLFTERPETLREITEYQLKKWGVKYHKLIFHKLKYDIIIDNRAVSAFDYFEKYD